MKGIEIHLFLRESLIQVTGDNTLNNMKGKEQQHGTNDDQQQTETKHYNNPSRRSRI